MGGDRVIARHLASVRVEAPAGTLNLQPRRDHRPVHIQGQPPQCVAGYHLAHQLLVHPEQCRHAARIEAPQPATHRMGRRHPAQATQPFHHGIRLQVPDMPHPAASRNQQGQYHQYHRYRSKVAARQTPRRRATQPALQTQMPKKPSNQCQAGKRRQSGCLETKCQFTIDSTLQICSA